MSMKAFALFSLNKPILSFIKKNEETRKNDELNAELKSIKATLKKAVDECDRREDAHELSGLNILIPRNDFAPLNDESLYLIDLIGFSVLDENRHNIGSVVDTMSLPAQNIVVVKTNKGEVLIPYVDAHILLFDDKGNNLIVKNIEGLLN